MRAFPGGSIRVLDSGRGPVHRDDRIERAQALEMDVEQIITPPRPSKSWRQLQDILILCGLGGTTGYGWTSLYGYGRRQGIIIPFADRVLFDLGKTGRAWAGEAKKGPR